MEWTNPPDEENAEFMEEVYKKELGNHLKTIENGVAIGEIRLPPLAPKSPFDGSSWPETDERMNIIGQNGNDGLHYNKGEDNV